VGANLLGGEGADFALGESVAIVEGPRAAAIEDVVHARGTSEVLADPGQPGMGRGAGPGDAVAPDADGHERLRLHLEGAHRLHQRCWPHPP